ncbi:hypothetical protein TNCV_3096011 [Trichonephila clavipes]|nr:hypothetical protein TNCV_3096011 [Trichonephila clavipes]
MTKGEYLKKLKYLETVQKKFLVEFKSFTHLVILTKMNSPDYDVLVYMFILSTPASPLPSPPVASSSHEPSQDGISLMEQTMAPLEY